LVLIGDVAPDNEYQTREDKAAGRPVRQKIDNMTGERQWKATATDPDEPNANGRHSKSRSSRTSSRFRLARRFCRVCVPSSWQGLTAEPRVAGNGEFKYQSYVYRATGFTVAATAAGARSSQSIKPNGGSGSVEQPGEAA
jgi:hypothetical protein